MRTSGRILLTACVVIMFDSCERQSDTRSLSLPAQVSLTRVLHLAATDSLESSDPAALTVMEGGEDELPRGPESFDILEKGGIVVTDPLRHRLAFFDSTGKFMFAWNIGFAASSVTVMKEKDIEVVNATNGETTTFDSTGLMISTPADRSSRLAIRQGSAYKVGPQDGILVIDRHDVGGKEDTLRVSLDVHEYQFISISSVGIDEKGNAFVALEMTRGGGDVDVEVVIRKYDRTGRVLCSITDLAKEQFVPTTDGLRVRNGVVHQLIPLKDEVRINVWDTNHLQ